MFNEVRISGCIIGGVVLRKSRGARTATTTLQFSPSQAPITLFAGDGKLNKFIAGDLIYVLGRLVINKKTYRAGVLVTEANRLLRRRREDPEGDTCGDSQVTRFVDADNSGQHP